jgi:hypothetical protein
MTAQRKKFRGDDLSLEHRREIARFLKLPFDDEENQRMRAWAAFKRWHWKLQQQANADGRQ